MYVSECPVLNQMYVSEMMESMAAPRETKPLDFDRMDYGQYGDHTDRRPYATLAEGVAWYASQPDIQALPESMIVPLVARNFGLSLSEALDGLSGS